MDLIYANARLTIIAAAGDGPDYGLLGVSGTPRKPQPGLKVGSFFMASILPLPRWVIERSNWASREWTYQEGLSSKRRLIFTDHQIFYECNGMHCAEALVLPLDKLHVKSKRSFKACIPRAAFPHKTPGMKPWEFMFYVAEFNKRSLTYPDDALNAMQGIFNSFSNGKRPLYQFIGVPIPPAEAKFRNYTSYERTNRNPEECFLIGLSWYHVKPSRRRQNFPSWSWAGWFGEISPTLMSPSNLYTKIEDIKVWVEEDDGRLLEFPSLMPVQPFISRHHCKNRFIRLEAFTIQFSIVHLQKQPFVSSACWNSRDWLALCIPSDGYYAKFQASEETFIYAKVYFDQKERVPQQVCFKSKSDIITGIVVGKVGLPTAGRFVLVVQEIDKYAERVGLFKFDKLLTLRYNKKMENPWYNVEPSLLRKWSEELQMVKRTIRLG